MEIPSYITHYHLRDKRPFLNLSDLGELELEAVVSELAERRRNDRAYQRMFGPVYMELRKKTEGRMRELFVAAGGKPEREAPHYFVLGDSYWFKHLCPDTEEVRLELDEIPSELVSFTYPDSFVAMGFAKDYGLPCPPRPYHGKVFRKEALGEVVGEYGLPADDRSGDYENYAKQEFEKFIEFQIWADEPVVEHLM